MGSGDPPGSSPEPPRSRGGPKPNGGSVITAASQAGWKSHVRHVIRERCTVSKGEGEVRRRLSRAAAPAAGPGRAGAGVAARGRGPVVAVTGAARGLGHALAIRLAASARIGRVVAIDDHRGDVTGVHWRVVDVRDPALAGRLTGVDVLVHTDLDLAPDSDYRSRRAFNVRGAQTVLTAAAASRVGRVVLVTSAMVYGARPDNPVPLDEAARLLTVKGCAPRWQFCHTDDLVPALELAAAGLISGEFAVGCEGWLEQEQVEELSGLRRIELPAGLTFGTVHRLHRAGITPAAITDLHFVVYPWVVDCRTLRDAGWRPEFDNAAAFGVLLEQRAGRLAVAGRRLARKEATITAAGATAAAIVRRARRRHRAP